ncbi:Bgt-2214 [Blumeria graminis f. sp. tritici]|uniref:Bgt-2214 n=3 Tax=Blumeria graminis TaxID=34373 RepID=A0A9X9QFX7_BLUGR|nr:Bgt-2214 [Blumeria graminis f. sp. tritici]
MAVQKKRTSTSGATVENLDSCLAAAVFVPFVGFESLTEPPSQSAPPKPRQPAVKSARALQRIQAHQDVVRGQMMATILQQAERLKVAAKQEIEGSHGYKVQLEDGEVSETSDIGESPEIEEMFRRLTVPLQPGKNYELTSSTPFLDSPIIAAVTSPEPPSDPAALERQIRQRLAQQLQILLHEGIQRLEQYDLHCCSVQEQCEASLASSYKASCSESPRRASLPSSNASRRTSVEVARLSNGMPVSMERAPVRKLESLGELTRRSK